MDLNKLRALVFDKTGIKVETNDPIFALVALNEAVLSECVEQHISGLQKAAEQLGEQTTRLLEAGDRVRQLLLLMRHTAGDPVVAIAEVASAPNVESTQSGKSALPWHWIGIAGGISLSSALLVVAAQVGLGYEHTPSPKASITVPAAAPALTPEQTLLIQNGVKYAKMWSKLDPETQAKIQALAQ